jgi:hypothetical protein
MPKSDSINFVSRVDVHQGCTYMTADFIEIERCSNTFFIFKIDVRSNK